jgi:thioredoxin reductase (NADPH)
MVHDLIIIGSGPAGLTAGLYAGRYKMDTLIVGKVSGGLAAEAVEVWNFPSHEKITGIELMKKMEDQVGKQGISIKHETVKEIKKTDSGFLVKVHSKEYSTKNVILATGREKRKLGLKEEGRFLGKGISYCATCDAAFFKDKEVGVIGGGNSALTAALLLSRFAKKVYIIYRKEKFFRSIPKWIDEVNKNKKIETIFNAEVIGFEGKDFLEGVELKDRKKLKVGGLFIEIGAAPTSVLAEGLGVELNKYGFIKVNRKQENNVKGIFACGDITDNFLKQIITACGEGAIAAHGVYNNVSRGNE